MEASNKTGKVADYSEVYIPSLHKRVETLKCISQNTEEYFL